jgi:glycosyltransferase involved in cell wall biosynthesis
VPEGEVQERLRDPTLDDELAKARPIMSPRRVLVVAQDLPWPANSGSFQRLTNIIGSLAELADVDLFTPVIDLREIPSELPSDAPVARWTAVHYSGPSSSYSLPERARWVTSGEPLEIFRLAFDGPQRHFESWAQGEYDLVWYSKAHIYATLGRPSLGPSIVDLDDLEDRKIMARIENSVRGSARPPTLTARSRQWFAEWQARENARRWKRLQADISRQVAAVVVCSDLDATRLAAPNAWVVPNGYDPPETPMGSGTVKTPPTILLQGVLQYGPNADAAGWLVQEVGPRLRALVPTTRIRLVGVTGDPVRRLHHPPEVEVVGPVAEMAPELARADVIAVPIRYGSGTRVKILEGFAHRVPVVSTSLGAEGLGAVAGEHLLIADTADDFAAACARLFSDIPLRERLTENAYELLSDSHRWERARGAVQDLARSLLRTESTGPQQEPGPRLNRD